MIEWSSMPREFVARLASADADQSGGLALGAHLRTHPYVAIRQPATVPPARMFHALGYLVQQGYVLQQREVTIARHDSGPPVSQRQWRIAPGGQPPVTQDALF